MPRKPRFNLIGVPQHVIQRGNNREPCFFAETDYYRYLDDLKESSGKYQCQIHAYALMTNHVHLLVTPMEKSAIPHMMQALGRRYVRYMNATYHRTGTLWEGRYKASLVDSEHYLLACMRYIELNPVRAGMVEYAGEYQWSSYDQNAQSVIHRIIDPHPTYLSLGADADERHRTYRELFTNAISNDDTVHEIREALNHELVLGRSSFKDKVEDMTKRQTRLGHPGRPCIEEESGIYQVFE